MQKPLETKISFSIDINYKTTLTLPGGFACGPPVFYYQSEIAQTLVISPDSVKKAKYRLYKKIGINSAAELNELL